jgi:hypothetical protein
MSAIARSKSRPIGSSSPLFRAVQTRKKSSEMPLLTQWTFWIGAARYIHTLFSCIQGDRPKEQTAPRCVARFDIEEVKLGSYRFYYYRRGGGLVKSEDREFHTDESAFKHAWSYRNQYDIEVIEGGHLVARLTPSSEQTGPNQRPSV